MSDKKGNIPLSEQTEASFKLFDEVSTKRSFGTLDGNQKDLTPVLRCIRGPLLGEHFILVRAITTFGRDSKCNICVKDPKLSRAHCQIKICQKSALRGKFDIEIEDLGSRNGIWVNEDKVQGFVKVKNGDQLKIGSNVFGLYLKFQEEIELENYLYKLATRDSTTGLLTRAFFDSNLEFEFKRSLRYKRPMTFVIMDIDHFKNINDKYGHQVGDEVLNRIGRHILEELRFEDTAIRYGGEEFAMILPETSEEDAYLLIERVRKNLEKIAFKVRDEQFRVTASFGIAEVKDSITTPELLIEKADKALYQAKNTGRNKSVFASKLAS